VKVFGTPASVTLFPEFAVPATIVNVDVDVAIVLPAPLVPSVVVKVKLSEPGGTNGPLTAHGQLPGVMDEVTLVVRPVGGAAPLTVFNVMVTD
jgi:hypothetical protein